MSTVHDKIGIDANRPIDPDCGAIAPQVADPAIIGETGAGWVRLNFIAGPWSGPDDTALHNCRTWLDTYRQIVADFRGQGLQIYGLINHEATGCDPGDDLRNPPPDGDADHDWICRYVATFTAIVEQFHADVPVFESFNEPDDWHGSTRNWIHPGWFAIMLQRLYDAIQARPALADVRLVSGPLQGLSVNNNGAAVYLRRTYQEGKRRFGWTRNGTPVPFHGVGYHLYVAEEYHGFLSSAARREKVRNAYHAYVDGLRRVILEEEGRDTPIYISEIGWHTNRNPENYQVEAMREAFANIVSDPSIALGIWFCIQDFGPPEGHTFYGLIRPGPIDASARKPAYAALQEICRRPEPVAATAELYNHVLIKAVALAAAELGISHYDLIDRAGLWRSFFDRTAPYTGPSVAYLPGLSAIEQATVDAKLAALLQAGHARRAETVVGVLNLRSGPDTDHPILDTLPLRTPLLVLDELGDWLRVEVVGREGFVQRDFVALLDEREIQGFLRHHTGLQVIPLQPPVAQMFASASIQDPAEQRLILAWNRYGRLIAAIADELHIALGVAAAVLAVESGHLGFARDGRLIIRFENHIFHQQWGQAHTQQFQTFFQFDPDRPWLGHRWRPAPTAEWREQHSRGHGLDANQQVEWESFDFACTLDERAAKLAIRMGAPRIIGFCHTVIGYESVEEMFDAFVADDRAQLLGLFDFVKAHPVQLRALRRRDFLAFAVSYNGMHSAYTYAGRLAKYVTAFERLKTVWS